MTEQKALSAFQMGTVAGVTQKLEKDPKFQTLPQEKRDRIIMAITNFISEHSTFYLLTHRKELKQLVENELGKASA